MPKSTAKFIIYYEVDGRVVSSHDVPLGDPLPGTILTAVATPSANGAAIAITSEAPAPAPVEAQAAGGPAVDKTVPLKLS